MNDMNTLIPNERGIWIECCYPGCKKWRYSIDYEDPLTVPEKWYCHMNSDQSVNSCSAPESVELEEGEIFVESKFKAGSIVWAKVIGYPWSIAMVDFCPEYEAYYWFDKVDTNVPSQYNVTFLNGKIITRAWLKSKFIKPFVGNTDPSFALKSRVCNKKLTVQQKAGIREGCKIAHAALRLSLAQRLKKYNHGSWRLSQQFRDQFTNSGKKPSAPTAVQNTAEGYNNCAGPSGTSKNKSIKILPPNLEKPAPLSAKRRLKAPGKKSAQEIDAISNTSSGKIKSGSAVPAQDKDHVARTDETQELEDTRSINSYDSMELVPETPVAKERLKSAKKQILELRPDGGPTVEIVTTKRLSEEKMKDMMAEALDEIIPNSQPSTPGKRSFNKTAMKHDANQPGKGSDVEIMSEEFEAEKESFKNPGRSICSIDLKLKAMMKDRRRLDATGQKSASENLLRMEDKENRPSESMYRKALSEFTLKEQQNPLTDGTNYRPRSIAARKPVSSWLSDPQQRKIVEMRQLSRLSKLSDEEDNNMYKESRKNFIAEMESTATAPKAGPSKEGNKLMDLKPPSYFMNTRNYDDLLTSDEESF